MQLSPSFSKRRAGECVLLSHVHLSETPWTEATRLLCPWGLSRQEHWSGLPCPPPGDLPNLGTECASLAAPALVVRFFTTEQLRMGSPGSSDSKETAYNVGGPGSIPGLERPLGEGKCNPLQYSCLGNSMDRRAWQPTVHGAAKNQAGLRN